MQPCHTLFPGQCMCQYLPTSTLALLLQGKELDYEAMAREHRALAGIIREHSGGKRVEPQDKLVLRTQVCVRGGGRGEGGGAEVMLVLKTQMCGGDGGREGADNRPVMWTQVLGVGSGGGVLNWFTSMACVWGGMLVQNPRPLPPLHPP